MAINTEKSQLGVGSGNILSWDTIDKFKEMDTKALIKPLEKEIQSNLTKQLQCSQHSFKSQYALK